MSVKKQAESQAESNEERRNREMVESIAKNISALSKSVSALLSGPLNRKAVVLLLANSSGMSQSVVSAVLNALGDLEKDWLNK